MFGTKHSIRIATLALTMTFVIPSWIFPGGPIGASPESVTFGTSGLSPVAERSPAIRLGSSDPTMEALNLNALGAGVGTAAPMFQTSSGFDHCVQDDTDPSKILRFNSTNGAFLYSQGGQTLFTGTGSASTVNGCPYFNGRSGGNSARATYSNGCMSASATITWNYAPGAYSTFTISNSNVNNDTCATTPTVGVLSPSGGEILDVSTTFNIVWSASDQFGIVSQDILLSTNGGSTFSTIINGLSPSVTTYGWTVPAIPNNTNAVIQVIAHNAEGNQATGQSALPFTIWNPAAAYTHVAEAPMFLVSGAGNSAGGQTILFDSSVELCNDSPNSIAVEVAPRVRNAAVSGLAPVSLTISAQMHKTVALSSFFSFSSAVPKTFMGSVRLRHNGSSDGDIRALILADDGGADQSFTVPFIYPASALSATGTMQCAPLYNMESATSPMLALQNATNGAVTATVTLHYGDGGLAGTAGSYQLPPVSLYAQQTALIDLTRFKSNLQGATWGSIAVTAPPQSVVAHAVMINPPIGCAYDSTFVDPATCTQTAMTASGLSIDAATGRMACLMVCNDSSSSRTVNISYQTNNGISIPSTQLTLSAGQQKMIEITPGQVLPNGGSTMADARISYTGSPGDVLAGGVSMSHTDARAIPTHFAEAKPGDGRRLISPFFWFDERVTGLVQVSNLGSSTVKAGVEMMFDNMTLFPLNTDVVTIPAGATATLNLQNYFSIFDDGVTAQGCLQLVHNGTPGTVTASFVALGIFSSIGLSIPLQGGPQFGNTEMALFPNQTGMQPGDQTQFQAMAGASLSSPAWSVSSTVGNPGSIAGQSQTDPLLFPASYTASTDPSTFAVTVKADASSGGGPVDTAAVAIRKVKLIGFSAIGSRLSTSTPTNFSLTANAPFPSGALTVKFRQGGQDFPATGVSVSQTDPTTLNGTAQPNPPYLGDATVIVFDANGNKISKDLTATRNATGSPYYAVNPPGSISTIATTGQPGSAFGHDRAGGDLTINGSDITKPYASYTTSDGVPHDPKVRVETGLDVGLSSVTPSQLIGVVSREVGTDIPACNNSPCKSIITTNPGGRPTVDGVRTDSLYDLYPGPAPTISSISENQGPSTGNTQVIITGTNLDYVTQVTFGGKPVQSLMSQSLTSITVMSPVNCQGPQPLQVTNVDSQSASIAFTYQFSRVTSTTVSGVTFYYVGGCTEGVDIAPGSTYTVTSQQGLGSPQPVNPPCVPPPTLQMVAVPTGPGTALPSLSSDVHAFQLVVTYVSSGCPGGGTGNPPINYDLNIKLTLRNSAAPNNTALQVPLSVDIVFVKF